MGLRAKLTIVIGLIAAIWIIMPHYPQPHNAVSTHINQQLIQKIGNHVKSVTPMKNKHVNFKYVVGARSSYADSSINTIVISASDAVGQCEKNVDCIAGILAHELKHIMYREVVTGNPRVDQRQEREADIQGIRWAHAAGFDCCAILIASYNDLKRFGNLGPPTHPYTTVRIKYMKAECMRLKGKSRSPYDWDKMNQRDSYVDPYAPFDNDPNFKQYITPYQQGYKFETPWTEQYGYVDPYQTNRRPNADAYTEKLIYKISARIQKAYKGKITIRTHYVQTNRVAWSLGNDIYISNTAYEGLCKRDIDCIAGIIGHELVHSYMYDAYIWTMTTHKERRADVVGAWLTHKAGYDSRKVVSAFEVAIDAFGDVGGGHGEVHPKLSERIRYLKILTNKLEQGVYDEAA